MASVSRIVYGPSLCRAQPATAVCGPTRVPRMLRRACQSSQLYAVLSGHLPRNVQKQRTPPRPWGLPGPAMTEIRPKAPPPASAGILTCPQYFALRTGIATTRTPRDPGHRRKTVPLTRRCHAASNLAPNWPFCHTCIREREGHPASRPAIGAALGPRTAAAIRPRLPAVCCRACARPRCPPPGPWPFPAVRTTAMRRFGRPARSGTIPGPASAAPASACRLAAATAAGAAEAA